MPEPMKDEIVRKPGWAEWEEAQEEVEDLRNGGEAYCDIAIQATVDKKAALAQRDEAERQLEAKDGYKLFVWQDRHRFVAMAHALTMADARQAIWDEDGTVDESVPIRSEMHRMVREETATIFRGQVAYAVLTESAELEESDEYRETQRKRIKELEAENTQLRAEVERLRNG